MTASVKAGGGVGGGALTFGRGDLYNVGRRDVVRLFLQPLSPPLSFHCFSLLFFPLFETFLSSSKQVWRAGIQRGDPPFPPSLLLCAGGPDFPLHRLHKTPLTARRAYLQRFHVASPSSPTDHQYQPHPTPHRPSPPLCSLSSVDRCWLECCLLTAEEGVFLHRYRRN